MNTSCPVSERASDATLTGASLHGSSFHFSRAQLQLQIDSMPVACITSSPEFRITSWNPAAEKIFGYSAQEALGSDLRLIVPPGVLPHVDEIWQRLLASHTPVHGVNENLTKDGRTIVCDWTNTPLRNGEDAVLGVLCIAQDITQRKQAEAELATERDLLNTLLENLPDAIYFKDRQSRFVRVSRSKLKKSFDIALNDHRSSEPSPAKDELPAHLISMDSYSRHLLGKSDFDFLDERYARPIFEAEQEIIRTGKPIIGKIEQVVQKDGAMKWVLSAKMPWRDKTGKIIGTFGTSKDITPIKLAEAKLEEVHRQLLETSRQAGMAEIATNVLHNVGNVLNSVNVSVSLLVDQVKKSRDTGIAKLAGLFQDHATDLGDFLTNDPKGKQVPAYLTQLAECLAGERAVMAREVGGLQKNIDHIKEIVAMQQNYAKVAGTTETVKATDLTEDAVKMNANALERESICLLREYAEPAPEITIERHKTLQILVNLIRNARQACGENGSREKRLTVRVAAHGHRVRISLIDNGVGIPRENLTRIFNYGFTTKKGGHGFGLHSSALAAKELGGSLSAHSNGPGTGASFTLELPTTSSPRPDSS